MLILKHSDLDRRVVLFQGTPQAAADWLQYQWYDMPGVGAWFVKGWFPDNPPITSSLARAANLAFDAFTNQP